MERSGSYHDRRLSPGLGFPPTQRIGIFVYEEFEHIDVFGFAEAFTIARFLGNGYGDPLPYRFAVTLIGCGRDAVKSANGPVVLPDLDMDQAADDPREVLMTPAAVEPGRSSTRRPSPSGSPRCSTGCSGWTGR
jgi:transcriptional regulator GlxA family with amidase domain